ncbi:HisA/HisF-related TIM barrel protein [Methylonatrum kenyense]|uniref:HisA/HisF-related TIM barrel protein n=1 Tax=Methylonatrum kenyense TaxID=455253 RepID=UPI0020C03623|nr:HisA/HisF-related TIM barrel protein [Methylonatrum kenyense]MCK8515431.1 HisA/HisF-related TIM barrel protein [Methylonatrum kenyense]
MSAPLQIIPAVDLMHDRVVRAAGGSRDRYQPLDCALIADSRPEAVLAALLELHPFDTLYLADLDAITGSGDQLALVAALARDWPGTVWLDAGPLRPPEGVRPVLGSEAFASLPALRAALAGSSQPVLSLDRRGAETLGPKELEQATADWPQDLILMDLRRVGSNRGPDLARLEMLRQRAPDHRFHLAGGIRHAEDLQVARDAGAAGVLLASALWDCRLAPDRLTAICTGQAD